MTRRLGLLLATLLCLFGAGCGDDGDGGGEASPTTFVSLDGRPRHPDVEGRLVSVAEDFSTLQLDGDREYEISPDLQSFSAADGSIQPLVRWKDQYVQIGLEDDTVVWLGGVSSVVEAPGSPAVAYVTGVAVEADGSELVLRSGAVFRLADDVEAPKSFPVAVVLTIDVERAAVVEIAPG